jgi:hypothetical protein
MYNEGDQRQSAATRLPSTPASAIASGHRPHNLAPTGSFWRRFQEWERTESPAISRSIGVAC